MIIKIGLWVCLTASLLLMACVKSASDEALARQNTVGSDAEIEVSVWDSSLIETMRPALQVSEIRLRNREALQSVSFIDTKHGWAGGSGARLYKTEDGGASWEFVPIDGPDLNAQNVFFLNSLVGWVVLQKDSPVPMESDSYLRLIRTSDGGHTWKVQYEGKGISATQLAFVDERNGWLTGIEYTKPPLNNYLILHTADQGEHWEDAAAALKRMLAEHPQMNDGIMGVAFKESTGATVITSELRMFQTTDQGNSWQRMGSIKNSYGQDSVVRRFGVIDGKYLWSIGGSSSPMRGTRGLLFIEHPQQSWTKYILNKVFFKDAVSLPNNRFLACGFMMETKLEGKTYSSHPEGIILYSPDGGRSWEVAYKNRRIQSVNAIASLTDRLAWAAADDGVLIRLELK